MIFSYEICFRWYNFCILAKTTVFGRFGGALRITKLIRNIKISTQLHSFQTTLPLCFGLTQSLSPYSSTPFRINIKAKKAEFCSCEWEVADDAVLTQNRPNRDNRQQRAGAATAAAAIGRSKERAQRRQRRWTQPTAAAASTLLCCCGGLDSSASLLFLLPGWRPKWSKSVYYYGTGFKMEVIGMWLQEVCSSSTFYLIWICLFCLFFFN